MTTYYAVSTGNWQGGNIWALSSGGAASVQTPTSSDDVVFDSHSTGTVTIGTASNCHNLTMTAPGAGTITMGGTAVLNVYGSMSLASGMTFAPAFAANINFLGTTTGLTIKHAGYLLPNMTYNGVGGEWTWQDNETNLSDQNLSITLTNGSLITNGFSAGGAANGISLKASNSNIRSLTLGSTSWRLNPTQSAAIWDLGTITNLTFSGASSTIILGAVSTFNGGGLNYGSVTGTLLNGAGDNFINGTNTFANLTLSNNGSGANMQDAAYKLSADQTITGTFTSSNGNNSVVNRRMYITSNLKGTPRTITAATIVADYLDLQDIVGTGAASWDLHAITGASGDCGGNSGITFTTPANQYYHASTASVTWGDSAKWFLATNGGGGSGRVPLPQDTAIFDAGSFTTTGITVNHNVYHSSAMNWTGVTNSPTFTNSVSVHMFGDQTLTAGMTLATISGSFIFEKRGILTINSAGLTIPWPIVLNSVTGVGSWPISSAFATSNTFLLTSGTVNLSNQLSVTGITLAGGVTTDAGVSGEYKGTTFSCTGGHHTLRKVTLSSTFAQSAGYIEVPVGGTISFATSWTWTGSTYEFKTLGLADWLVDVLTVTAPAGSGGSWLSC